jgi:malonyl-CoA decarboxylase
VFHSIWKVQERRAGRGSGRDLIEGAADALRAELPHLHTFITLSPVPGLRAWVEANGAEVQPVGDELAGLGARYLTSLDEVGRPLDPVARFHLSNGARLWRVNPDGDPSTLGVERSFGLLANYRYLPEDRAANRDLLADGTVPVGDAVGALLDAPRSADDHRA